MRVRLTLLGVITNIYLGLGFNKNTQEYSWQMQCKGYSLSKKEAYIKNNKLTNELREIYLNKKNFNKNPNKKSKVLYAEAVNELYNAHH